MKRADIELVARVIRNLPLADERRAVVAVNFADALFAAASTANQRRKFFVTCNVEVGP